MKSRLHRQTLVLTASGVKLPIIRRLTWVIPVLTLVYSAAQIQPAHASHILTENIRINGTPVDSLSGFTSPTITAGIGSPITFTFDAFSTSGAPDTLDVSFTSNPSTLPAPANTTIPYNGSGTTSSPVTLSYTVSYGTGGVFNGQVIPNLLSSFPDYQRPNGSQLSEPSIPFRLNVASPVNIGLATVGNPGNANDTTGFGAVANTYRIGTTEVTNSQYKDFLNAKAASDPLGLYNTNMGSNARGGITQSGASGSFVYAVKADMGNKPVNFVSFYDSIRFANWLNNGQGSGDTESGSYTLSGGTPTPSNGTSITRNAGANWFVPSENEWYKAAYFQPAAQGGDTDNYWLYPTASNSAPTLATANLVGDISNPGTNVANYNYGADWNSQDGNVTTVGSAGPLSDSFYGTADQGGNVYEWNEALISGSFRGLRGGSWDSSSIYLQSSNRDKSNPATEDIDFGFRVATATVPEPSTAVLAVAGLLSIIGLSLRRGKWPCAARPNVVCAMSAALLVAVATAAQADTFSVPWQSPTTDVDASNFNIASITFAPINSWQLLGISDNVGAHAYFHSHSGGTVTGLMDIHLNGAWTNIFLGSTTSLAGYDLTSLGPINFPSGTVDGIRFQGIPAQNQTFHEFDGALFTFTVPEPSTWVLAALGLLSVSALALRRASFANGRSTIL